MPYSDLEKAREAKRKHYYANKQQYLDRNKRDRKNAQQHVLAYLLANPCVDCGEKDVRCLEFDHRDRANKSHSITKMITDGLTIVRIDAEIAKCDVRCANCHRKVTAGQFGWYRVMPD